MKTRKASRRTPDSNEAIQRPVKHTRKPSTELRTPSKRRRHDNAPKADSPSRRDLVQDHVDVHQRPAGPHITNAPLVTPHGSRILKHVPSTTPPVPFEITQSTSSAATILDEACAHLIKVEPKLKPLIELHYCEIFSPRGLAEECRPFSSLVSGIVAQQVSGAAAASIKRKFLGLFFPESDLDLSRDTKIFPTPEQVAACTVKFLRQAGLSERKAEYVQGLAERFANGELSANMLLNASDEEVLEKLTAVRGLGRWSVEMFACFGLKRMDIFSTGDLGVQRGMAAFVGKDIRKLKAKGGKWKYMSEQDMIAQAAKFAPYRSVFMWYMWRVEGVDVNTVEHA